MANLGYVGLGVMGGQMVARLLERGHTVTGYIRMKWADSRREVCAASGITGDNGLLAGLGAGWPSSLD